MGFMMLANAGRFGITGQIIASLKHRDKSPNNALIAKAVELCAAAGPGLSDLPVLERRLSGRVQAPLRLRAGVRATLLGAAHLEGSLSTFVRSASRLEGHDPRRVEGMVQAAARALVRAGRQVIDRLSRQWGRRRARAPH